MGNYHRRKMSTNIAFSNWFTTEYENHLNLWWSLRPILILMRFLGYELDLSRSSTVFWRYFKLTFGLLLFSSTLGRAITMIRYVFFRLSGLTVNGNGTVFYTTEIWNFTIISCSEAVNVLGIHLSMYLVAIFKWKHLWKCLQKIERLGLFPANFYKKLRRVCYYAVLYIASVKCGWM